MTSGAARRPSLLSEAQLRQFTGLSGAQFAELLARVGPALELTDKIVNSVTVPMRHGPLTLDIIDWQRISANLSICWLASFQ